MNDLRGLRRATALVIGLTLGTDTASLGSDGECPRNPKALINASTGVEHLSADGSFAYESRVERTPLLIKYKYTYCVESQRKEKVLSIRWVNSDDKPYFEGFVAPGEEGYSSKDSIHQGNEDSKALYYGFAERRIDPDTIFHLRDARRFPSLSVPVPAPGRILPAQYRGGALPGLKFKGLGSGEVELRTQVQLSIPITEEALALIRGRDDSYQPGNFATLNLEFRSTIEFTGPPQTVVRHEAYSGLSSDVGFQRFGEVPIGYRFAERTLDALLPKNRSLDPYQDRTLFNSRITLDGLAQEDNPVVEIVAGDLVVGAFSLSMFR